MPDQPTAAIYAGVRAGIYTRISRDDDLDRLGVQRQEEDCRRLVDTRGWTLLGVYEDNDLSGSGKVQRLNFSRLLLDMREGRVDVVVAWDIDRLMRGFREFITFYETCETRGLKVVWLGGEADFGTGTGLLELEIRASFAREELRKLKRRLRRWHQQRAEHGEDAGAGRPFGFEADRSTIRAEEAALVEEAARRVLAGDTLRSVCMDWDERGVATVNGAGWTTQVLSRILRSSRISGRRERITVPGTDRRRKLGEITATATWPGIISPDQSDALRALLSDPERLRRRYARDYLLTGGLAVCGLCGHALVARPKSDHRRCMVCASGPGFHGCGKIRTLAEPVEDLVSEAVLRAVEGGELARLLSQRDDRVLAEELAGVEDQLRRLGGEWGGGGIDDLAFGVAAKTLGERRTALRRRLEAEAHRYALGEVPDPLRPAWASMSMRRRRVIVAALIDAVVIEPAVRGRNRFDPSRVSVRWL